MKQKLSLLLAVVCLLLLPACTESELADQNGEWPGLKLNPGEQAVTFTLKGAGSGAVTAAREASDAPATREATDKVTLPGETDIEKLDIYCFIQSTGATADAASLERVYHYARTGATANDFLLIASADGYKLGIGMPEDALLRRFLMIANDNEASRTVTVGTTTYADVKGWNTATLTADATRSLAAPFIMTSTVPKPVLMNDGSYTYKDEPFSAADLAKGINVQVQRRVARIDLANPVSDFFEVTGIDVKGFSHYSLFGEAVTAPAIQYGLQACANAVSVPGAYYCYPGGTDGSADASVVSISGNYLGTETTITTAGTQLLPNTRYVVRIHDTNHNLSATLEVLPWDDGNEIDASITGTYAAQLNVSVFVGAEVTPYAGDGSEPVPYAYIDKVKHIIWVAGNWLTPEDMVNPIVSHPFLQLQGGADETAPVGIILPDALQGRVKAAYDNATGITLLSLIPTEEELTNARGLFVRKPVLSPPASVTFITQPGGAGTALKYEEWVLIEDFFRYNTGGMITTRGIIVGGETGPDISSDFPTEVNHRSTSTLQSVPVSLETGTAITLSPYCNESCILFTSAGKRMNSSSDMYWETAPDWLSISTYDDITSSEEYNVFVGKDNDTGKTREAILVVRRLTDDGDGERTTGGMEERRYRIVQPPVTDATQTALAASASLRPESMHTAEELSITGNTINMNYGTYRDDDYATEMTRARVVRSDHFFPLSILSEGRKPVRVLLPADCDWLTQQPVFTSNVLINTDDGLYRPEPTPANFVRQLVVTPNKTSFARSVTFRIETYAGGEVRSTAYTLVQQPTEKQSSGGIIM